MKADVYKRYMVGVLLMVTAHNFVDRNALGLLLQSIKLDLLLTDTQLGLLTGVAFALFYSVAGIPIARWADRGNRILIITLTTALWSAAVTLCGMARSFLQLLLIRIGVAVGEAGCFPPSHSLIADYFTRAERPRAVAIYLLGGPLGMLIGYLSAGWLNELYGWRVTFMLLGLPGLALAALVWFTLREPRRAKSSTNLCTAIATTAYGDPSGNTTTGLTAAQPSVLKACTVLWGNRTFRHLWLCISVSAFFAYGILQWLPAFFIRTYGLATGEAGTWFATINGFGGLLGTYLGGVLASRYAVNNEVLQLRAMAIANVAFSIFSAAIYVLPTLHLAFGSLAFAMIGGCAVNGPLYATIQMVVPDRMRATAIALVYLLANLIGMGLGPLTAGVLSDLFRPWAGEESLRYALLILCPGYIWVACHLWQASKTVTQDLIVVQSQENRIRERAEPNLPEDRISMDVGGSE